MAWGIAMVAGARGAQVAVALDGRIAPLAQLMSEAGSSRHAPSSVQAMLDDWDGWVNAIDGVLAAQESGLWSAVEDATLQTPISDPPSVYCCGANYYDHIAEMRELVPDFAEFHKDRETVFHFLVPPEALTADRCPVIRPADCRQLDWEVEVVAVVGRRADRVAVDDALYHIAGYTVANDVSLRDPGHRHRLFGVNFLMAKGQRAMKPIGPCVVPARFVEDVQDLTLSLTVNGMTRQESSTGNMIWSLAEQIAHLSSMIPLRPGDLIFTGTPAGTAAGHGTYLRDGDEMVATVAGIGSLHNRVVGADGSVDQEAGR